MGWVLVEFPIGTRPIPQLFPIRNGLSSDLDLYAKPVLLLCIALD